jgi:hypothetical protein
MDTQDLTLALEQLITAQTTLMHLKTWLSALVLVLVVVTLAGFVWVSLEMRAIRHMLVHMQTSAEHIAEMTRDVLRRVE